MIIVIKVLMNDIRDLYQTIHIIDYNKTWDESSLSIIVFQSFLDVNNIYIIPKDDIPDKTRE